MFYNAMRCSGVSALEAKTMYYALLRSAGTGFCHQAREAVTMAQTGGGEAAAPATAETQEEIQGARDGSPTPSRVSTDRANGGDRNPLKAETALL